MKTGGRWNDPCRTRTYNPRIKRPERRLTNALFDIIFQLITAVQCFTRRIMCGFGKGDAHDASETA
jgi:hypothetical protein